MGIPNIGRVVSLHRASLNEPTDAGRKVCGFTGPEGWVGARDKILEENTVWVPQCRLCEVSMDSR